MAKKLGIAAAMLFAGCSGVNVRDGDQSYSIHGSKGIHTEQKAYVDSTGKEWYSSRTIGVGLEGQFSEVDQDIFGDRKNAGKLQTSIDGAAKEKVYEIKKKLIEERYSSQIESLRKELEAAQKANDKSVAEIKAKLDAAEQKYRGALKALEELEKFQDELQKPEPKK